MPIERLKGKTVLEVGCGAGRFTELMVHAKALVHSIDLSVAVEANQENIGTQINYRIAQADLRNPPFSPNSFDFVFCLGVLQHTPSTEESIKSIYAMVKPGGILVIDHYIWSIKQVTKLMWLYRMILKRLSPTRSKKITDRLVDIFFPLHKAVGEFFPAQALLSRVSPCLVYFHYHPELSDELQLDWSRLDTYDQLTDYYKRLHTPSQIHRMLDSVGADNVRITRNGNGVEARCQKPKTA